MGLLRRGPAACRAPACAALRTACVDCPAGRRQLCDAGGVPAILAFLGSLTPPPPPPAEAPERTASPPRPWPAVAAAAAAKEETSGGREDPDSAEAAAAAAARWRAVEHAVAALNNACCGCEESCAAAHAHGAFPALLRAMGPGVPARVAEIAALAVVNVCSGGGAGEAHQVCCPCRRCTRVEIVWNAAGPHLEWREGFPTRL